MRVGGREFDMTREQVEARVGCTPPDGIQKYWVEVNGLEYPPKQVLALATGWDRQSFTTLEAQRVLNKIGFQCRPIGSAFPSATGTSPEGMHGEPDGHALARRLLATEAALATAQEAIAGLAARVKALEQH